MKGCANKDIVSEEVLQAVILAEPFNTKFQPLTESTPFALLPLLGRPLLDYNLELLHSNGFNEVFVFCCSKSANKIKEFVSKSKWNNDRLQVKVISADNYLSQGDMMRDLDGKAYIRGDFLLLNAGVISNQDLNELIQAHKKNMVSSNGSNLMTVVCKKLCVDHKTRSPDESFVVALDPLGKVLHAHFFEKNSKYLDLPLEVVQNNPLLSIRADLAETKMAFCATHVPAIFSDNFDYQDSNDFVKGIIEHEEIMGNSIYMFEATESYCAAVTDMTLYERISLDVAKRWAYPYVVDMSREDTIRTGNHYRSSSAKIHPTASVGKFSVILGEVGEESEVNRSFVGVGTQIGKGVKLVGVTLGNNVKIEEGCYLSQCFVADDCVVYKGSTLSKGCVLGAGVKIGPNVDLKTKILQNSPPVDDGFGDSVDSTPAFPSGEVEASKKKFGSLSVAYEYVDYSGQDGDGDGESSDGSEESAKEHVWGGEEDRASCGFYSAEEDNFISDDEAEDQVDHVEDAADRQDQDDTTLFFKEVYESLQRGVEENIKAENLILEINSSKHAYNVTINEVVEFTVKAMLSLCTEIKDPPQDFRTTFKKSSTQIAGILRNYLKKTDSQKVCVATVSRFYTDLHREGATEATMKTMQTFLNFLYQKNILEEDAITEWYHAEEDNVTAGYAKELVDWLEQESSDEDDEDDEESD